MVKKIIPAIIVALVSGFMFFIYEPLTMYATNIEDFWFDIQIMIKPCIELFGIYSICTIAFFSVLYKVNNHFSDKVHLYKAIVLLSICFLIISYVHGNFFISNLPVLDGSKIDWSGYAKESVVSSIIIIVVFSIVIFMTRKFKYDNIINKLSFIIIAVFLMMTTSLIGTLTKDGVFNQKEKIIVTTKENINDVSTNSNFFILLVDAVDSSAFSDVIKDNKYNEIFNDFTYYPDTMGVYRFTRDTIPFLFSNGELNRNEKSFKEYYNNSFNDSSFIKALNDSEYKINFYEQDFNWIDDRNHIVSNIKNVKKSVNLKQFLMEISKYNLFKYLPYPIKKYSRIQNMNFVNCQILDEGDRFSWDDKEYYNIINDGDVNKVDEKYFSFIHLEGAHVPFNYDQNLNEIEDGTYKQKIQASLKVIDKFINRLKQNEAYDNSVIIIMSDHGFGESDGVGGRQNPILFVKGINEKHDMIKSDKPVSYMDFSQMCKELLREKKSTELFENIDYDRVRPFLWYDYARENHMLGYEQKGRAWDESTMIPTGKEYNR